MPLNLGYMELGGGGVVARVYYDANVTPVGDSQPLINGPRGYCLDLTNTTGAPATVVMTGATNNPRTINVGQGDPVTTGVGRSRTAAELAAFGFTTRGDIGSVSLS
jgi:hypothetical protein